MGVQTLTSSDNLRTIWTTAMDRYFIDLMLEQVGKGNRIDDHLFSKQAWKHMTSLFSAKFGFQYNRDHLKNRHKTLRKLFKATKNLLEQSGFSWDETQQMVTADDRVWNNYIKAHPDARSYRTKCIPYYGDLCKIFKNMTSHESYNHSIDNANDENDVSGAKIGGVFCGVESSATSVAHEDPIGDDQYFSSNLGRNKDLSDQQDKQQAMIPSASDLSTGEGMVDAFHEMDTPATSSVYEKEENGNSISTENVIDALEAVPDTLDATSNNRSRTYWQPPMDRHFIDLMLDQVHKGNQFDGTFRKCAWMHMLELFNEKFSFKYGMVILKNRYKTLKRQYNAIKILLDQEGFVWDDTRQMVTADDHIWHNYIKAHPDAKQYITRPVPYYNDLCVIFRDVTSDERYSYPGHNMDQQDEVLESETDRGSRGVPYHAMTGSLGDPVDSVQETSSYSGGNMGASNQQNKRQFVTLTSQISKKQRSSTDRIVMDYLPEMATTVKSSHLNGGVDITDLQNKHQLMTPSTSQQSKRPQKSSDKGVVNALREMATVVTSLSDTRKEPSNSFSTENVIYALQAVPDIDEDLILDACDFLEDEKKAKTFLSLDVRLRKKWLMRKLRP